MLTENYKQAITELLAILENFDQNDLKKVPISLLEFFKENASKTYKFSFNPNKKIKDLKLKKETKGLLSMLYLYYWCEPKNIEAYMNILKDNNKKLDELIRKSYNPDSPFNGLW